jgi:hypothetical protein
MTYPCPTCQKEFLSPTACAGHQAHCQPHPRSDPIRETREALGLLQNERETTSGLTVKRVPEWVLLRMGAAAAHLLEHAEDLARRLQAEQELVEQLQGQVEQLAGELRATLSVRERVDAIAGGGA